MAQGGSTNLMNFVKIPISIALGIVLGAITGYCLSLFFETAYAHNHCLRNSIKTVVVLGAAFMLLAIETWLEEIVPVSGLLAVVSMAGTVKVESVARVTKRLSKKFSKIWIAARVIRFVLVGAAADVGYTLDAGIAALPMIFIALVFQPVGVVLCWV